MSQKNDPVPGNQNKKGPVYIVNMPGGKQAVISVTEWQDPATKNNWHYFLRLNDAKNSTLLREKEIAITGKQINHEQIIGRLGNTIWIITDSLVGYDQYSLEPAVTEATIIAANPSITANPDYPDSVSRHAYSYLLDEAAQVMYLRTENGEQYKLYPNSLVLKPDDNINEKAPDDYSYEIAANYKLYDRYEMKSALNCIDSSDNNLYILGSEKETGYVLSYFGTAIFPEREELRNITIVPYHRDGEKLDYAKHPPFIGKNNYFKAGFLLNKFTTTAWKSDNRDRIILYQSNTGNKATTCVALIDRNGTEKWKTDTGAPANNFTDYLISDNNLLLWFRQYQKEKNTSQTIIFNIDLNNGKISH